MVHKIRTEPTHSTFEVMFWRVLVGLLTVAFLIAMVLTVRNVS